jgi:hypothetical protein
VRRIGVVLALAGTFAMAFSSSSKAIETTGKTATGAGVTVTLPKRWTARNVSGRGLVAARRTQDLDTDVPSGPRLVATQASSEIPDPQPLFDTAKGEQVSVRKSKSVTVGGKPGIEVESTLVRQGVSMVARQVLVKQDKRVAYTFTLEAPDNQWDANKGTLQTILKSVRFAHPKR